MRRFDVAERRARLTIRHHLAPSAQVATPVEAARDMVGLHATDPASVYLAALARTPPLDVATMERELYEEGSLLKILGMRRTNVRRAAGPRGGHPRGLHPGDRGEGTAPGHRDARGRGIPDPTRWLADAEEATVAALEARGEAVATELTRDVPPLAMQIAIGVGKKWQGTIGMSTRVLFLLNMEGRIVRARPRGSWISSPYRWTPVDRWIAGGIPELPTDEARVELVRRWLTAFGPGTIKDIEWWTGWTLGETRRVLEGVETTEVELDGGTGIVLADDLEPAAADAQSEPWLAFLPALDPTIMGWAGRDWYLGPHRPALFDTNGNAGPTIWWSGRVVGGWAQRHDGSVRSACSRTSATKPRPRPSTPPTGSRPGSGPPASRRGSERRSRRS